jgi:hypothetical protein
MACDHHGCVPPIDNSDSSAPKNGGEDPDHPAERAAAHQREPGAELDHAPTIVIQPQVWRLKNT